MVSCGADKGRAQSRAKPGRLLARSQAPTAMHSSTAVTSAAKDSTTYQYRHYKPTIVALSRYL